MMPDNAAEGRGLKTIRFTYSEGGSITGYRCSEPGEQSGEYVRAEVAQELRTELDNISAQIANEGPHTLEHLMAVASLGKHTTVVGRSRLTQLHKLESVLVRLGKTLQGPIDDVGPDPELIEEYYAAMDAVKALAADLALAAGRGT